MAVTRKEEELYVLTIAERLQYKIEPFLTAADIARNKKFFFLQATSHPDCVRVANGILGFKRNYLWNWLTKTFVFEVFGPLTDQEQAQVAMIIQREINDGADQVVLSKQLFERVRSAMPTLNPLVLRATFDRIFYSPRIKELLKQKGKTLSDRSVVIRRIAVQIEQQNARTKQLLEQHEARGAGVPEVTVAPPRQGIAETYLAEQNELIRNPPALLKKPERVLDPARARELNEMAEKNRDLLGYLF